MSDRRRSHADPGVDIDAASRRPCARSCSRSARIPTATGLLRTPQRVAEMYAEICAGLHEDPSQHLVVTFEANHDEMVLVRDIALYSHLRAPPRRRSTGARTSRTSPATTAASPACRSWRGSSTASPSGRRCRSGSRRRSPTRSSRSSQPRGAFVMIEAEHLCMSMRGRAQAGHADRHVGRARAVQGQCRRPGPRSWRCIGPRRRRPVPEPNSRRTCRSAEWPFASLRR